MAEARWRKFTRQEIDAYVKESYSLATLAYKLGYQKYSGSCISTVKSMIQELNLDTSHFVGQGWHKDKFDYDRFRKGIAIKSGNAIHALAHIRGHKCEECGLSEWLTKTIPLEIHHIDGDRLNNEMSNLLLLCPNCHALTDNYCGKNIHHNNKQISDDDFVTALQQSSTIRQALLALGLTAKGGNYQRARELIYQYNIAHLMPEHQDGKPLE